MSKLQKKGVPRHAGDPCPDPDVHQAQQYGSSNHGGMSRESILGPDGKLSAAGAAASLKYARPQDLPSYPSLGLYDETTSRSNVSLARQGASSSAGKAASLAADKGGKLDWWQYKGSETGHSAANLAVNRTYSPSYGNFGYDDEAKKKALQAATISLQRSKTGGGVKGWKNPLADTMSNDGLEASRFTHQHALGPAMFTEHPPVALEVEEQRYKDGVRAAAVVMAKRMYELEHNKVSAKEARGSSIGSQPQQYIGLEETAKKLAAQRLAALDPDGIQAYREHYGFGPQVIQQKPMRQSMRSRTTSQVSSFRDDSSDDDQIQAKKVRGQVANLRGQLADVDAQKRQKDRDNLYAAAERLVKARLANIDEKVFAETGKVPPAMQKEWEAQARAKATTDGEQRALTTGKVHIGGGKYMDQTEIDAIASARMQPVLDQISETAALQRQRDEEIRIAEEERRAADLAEKQRIQNEKDVVKLREFEERQKRDILLAEQKAERDRLKAIDDAEKRKLRDEAKAEKDRIKLHVYHDKQFEKSEKKRIEEEKRIERERVQAEERAERERLRAIELEERRIQAEKDAETKRLQDIEDAETARVQGEKDAETKRLKDIEDAEAARIQAEKDAVTRAEKAETDRIQGEKDAEAARVQAEKDAVVRAEQAEAAREAARLKTEKAAEASRFQAEKDEARRAEKAEKARAKTEKAEAIRAEKVEAAHLKAVRDAAARADARAQVEAGDQRRAQQAQTASEARTVATKVPEPANTTFADDNADEKTIRPNDGPVPDYIKNAEAAALAIIGHDQKHGTAEIVGQQEAISRVTSGDEPAHEHSHIPTSGIASPVSGTSAPVSPPSGIAAEPTETGEPFTEVNKPTEQELSEERGIDVSPSKNTSESLTGTSSAATSTQKQSRRKSFFSRFKRGSKSQKEEKDLKTAVASVPLDGPSVVGSKEPVQEADEEEEDDDTWEPAAEASTIGAANSATHGASSSSAVAHDSTTAHSHTAEAIDPTTSAHTTSHATTTSDEGLYDEAETGEHQLTPRASKGKAPLYAHGGAQDGRISPLEDDEDDAIERGRSVVSETDDDDFEEARTNLDTASEVSVPHTGHAREISPARSASKFQEEL